MKRLQILIRAVRQRERIAAGNDDAALPRRPQPARQQGGQFRRRRSVRQIVLEIVEEKRDPRRVEESLGEVFETVAPGMFRLAQYEGELTPGMRLGKSLGE